MSCKSFCSAIRLVVALSLLWNGSGEPVWTSNSDVFALRNVARSISNAAELLKWTGDPCLNKWRGIICSTGESPARVIGMDLSNVGLTGQISSEIGSLEFLQYLSLSHNQLSGPIPASIGRLSLLHVLHLDNNQLTGSIPIALGELNNLKELCLSNNNLSGELPKIIDDLLLLELLDFRKSGLKRVEQLGDSKDVQNNDFSREGRILQDSVGTPSVAPASSPIVTLPTIPPETSTPVTPATPPVSSPVSSPLPSVTPPPSDPSPSSPDTPPPLVSPSSPPPLVPSVAPTLSPPPPVASPLASPPLLPPPAEAPVVSPSPPPPFLPSPSSQPPTGPALAPFFPPTVPPDSPPPTPLFSPPALLPPVFSPTSPPALAPAVPPTLPPTLPPTNPPTNPPTFPPTLPPTSLPIAPSPFPETPIPVTSPVFPPPPRKRLPPPPKKGLPPPLVKRSPPPPSELPPSPPSPSPPPPSPPPPSPPPPSPPPPPPPIDLPPSLSPPPRPPPPPPPSPPTPPTPPTPVCQVCGDSDAYARTSDCQCVYPLYAWFFIDINFNAFKSFKMEGFRTQLASNLLFSTENIVFVEMVSGSVYLRAAFLPAAPDVLLTDSTIANTLSILQNTSNKTLSFTSDFGNVTVLNTTAPTSFITIQPPPPPSSKSEVLSTPAIIAIAAGGGALLIILALIILWCCCCTGRKHPKPVPDAPKNYAPPKAVPRPAGWAQGEGGEPASSDASALGRGREIEGVKDSNSPLISKREARDAPASTTVGTPNNLASPGAEAGVATAAAVATLNRMESRRLKKDDAGSGSQKKSLPVFGAQAFTVADLQVATNSFSLENKIGGGPMGSLYRADFAQGRALAIRKMDPAIVEGMSDDDFKAIVNNVARLRHPNIVELHGYCVQYGQRLLASQYFPGGSVYDFLHDPRLGGLTWDSRLRLAIGCARALEYIHEQVTPAVMHRNFKSTNILLDKEMQPHVADCGMAVFNLIGADNMIQGGLTYGAPEYMMSGVYTVMSDVYSFGVLLLELLTGREPVELSRPKPEQSLVRWAAPLLHDLDELEAMMDPQLPGPRPDKVSLTRFAEVITRCIQHEPELRPPMSKVVQDLIRRVVKQPKNNGLDRSPSEKAFNGDAAN